MLDIKGKKFGKLVVIEFDYINNGGHAVWRCKCDCGRETTGQTRFLRSGKKVSCGCQRRATGACHPTWQGVGELSKAQFSRLKISAKVRNIPFSVSIDFLWNLFLKQTRKCALSGEDITLFGACKTWGTASLDRIDSTKGYVENNVQWLHKDVNFMKSDLSPERFRELIVKINHNII